MGYTTTMRYTGLSGVDTASMVDAMMQVEAIKYNNLYKSNITTKYQQEAYQNVGNQLVDIQSSKFDILAEDSLIKESSYTQKKTSVTDENGNESNAITITTGGSSTNFDASVDVEQLADNDSYIVSASGAGTTSASNGMDLSSLSDGCTATVSIDGTAKTITFTDEDITEMQKGASNTADVLNNKLNETFGAGTTNKASFGVDADGNIQISAETGHSLKISNDTSETGVDLATALGFDSSTATTQKTSTTTMGDMFGIDGTTSLTINGDYTMEFNADTTVDEFMSMVNASGTASASFNQVTGSFTIESTKDGEANGLNLSSTTTHSDGSTTTTTGTDETLGALGSVNKVSSAQDAIIVVDGDTANAIHLDENKIYLNDGTKIEFNAVTDEAVDLSVEDDVQHTADMVHSFVDSYNAILDAIYSESKTVPPTDSSGNHYDPLTEEEAAALDSEEVEKWEEKAKEGVLYNDSNLKSIERSFRNAVSQPVELEDGTKVYLSDFGITLSDDYSEGGKLVVDDEKLNASIEKYGTDNVAYAFANGFAANTEEVLDQTVGMDGLLTQKCGLKSSPLYMANNQMTTKMNNNALKLERERERLEDKEAYYYKMFSNMETAIQESNSQLAALGMY